MPFFFPFDISPGVVELDAFLIVMHFQLINITWKGSCPFVHLAESKPCTNFWPNLAFFADFHRK